MDNKKTFADLFSSSTVNNEQEDSILDENIKNQENDKKNNQDQKITFDNLFEQTSEERKEQDEIVEEKKQINLNSILNLNDKTLSSDSKQNQEELNFFQEKEPEPQKEEAETNSSSSLENPFFEEETKPKEKSSEVELNFFQEKEPEPQKLEAETNSSSSLENPFFEEETKPKEKSSEIELTFLEKETNPEENIDENPNDSLSKINNSETSQENDKKEAMSISPFFENDTPKEENALFLNKINLIENEQHESKLGSIDPKKSKHFNVKIVKKKEPLFKFILGVISYAIFIWLLLIGITLLVYVLDIKIRAAKGDYSSPTFNAYVVLTGSMLPEIQVYDVVVTKKVDASTLKEGDIITFASADSRFLNTIITHRIIKKNYNAESKTYTFQTKGDNNNVADSALVPQNNIYGKVILKIPKLGYLQEFLASDGGWIIVILIPCLTVISYDIVKLAKGLKRKKYKNIKVQK